VLINFQNKNDYFNSSGLTQNHPGFAVALTRRLADRTVFLSTPGQNKFA